MNEEVVAKNLVYAGKVVEITPILNADLIESVTVICGPGGKWRGIARKSQFNVGDRCVVYLQDALIPPRDDMQFMEKYGWRVKMQRLRGAPSEVVIMPMNLNHDVEVGSDLTQLFGVTKYFKPVPVGLQCDALGPFPSFIPKTDEPNYQSNPQLVESLIGKGYYVTQKMDGSSTTAYKYNGHFGVCSRNWELKRNENSGYWKIVDRYGLEEKLPEGYAIQWETCGPGINGNRGKLSDVEGYAFSAYDIKCHKYLSYFPCFELIDMMGIPPVKIFCVAHVFAEDTMDLLLKMLNDGDHSIEGVVVRSIHLQDHAQISFKVINLNYEN